MGGNNPHSDMTIQSHPEIFTNLGQSLGPWGANCLRRRSGQCFQIKKPVFVGIPPEKSFLSLKFGVLEYSCRSRIVMDEGVMAAHKWIYEGGAGQG